MNFQWSSMAGEYRTRLYLHEELDGAARRSYIGAVHEVSSGECHALALELVLNPALVDVEESVYPTRDAAMSALCEAFTIAWIGATEEERENVWDWRF